MHLLTYILTIAEDEDDARVDVECFIEDNVGARGQAFDYGGVDCDEERKVVLLSEIRNELDEQREYPEAKLEEAFNRFDSERNKENRGELGFCALRIHEICMERFTEVMPYFNMKTDDWYLPENDTEKVREITEIESENLKWYAVPVDLHF